MSGISLVPSTVRSYMAVRAPMWSCTSMSLYVTRSLAATTRPFGEVGLAPELKSPATL
ncbi:hypothetical protein STENM327S_07826 [Streptomyces tendae]